MSKRRLGNLLKRKFSSWKKEVSAFEFKKMKSLGRQEFFRNQFQSLSKLGGDLIVMQMGN